MTDLHKTVCLIFSSVKIKIYMLLGHLLSLTMWIAGVCLLAFFQYVVVRAEETGNSLVTCTACQSVQAQIDNWSCDINCKVANGNNGIFDITSYICIMYHHNS